MNHFILPAFWILSLLICVMALSFSAHSQGLGDIMRLCNNATVANKAMAKQAGYDLDKLCADFKSVGQSKKAVPEQPKVARQTVSTSG